MLLTCSSTLARLTHPSELPLAHLPDGSRESMPGSAQPGRVPGVYRSHSLQAASTPGRPHVTPAFHSEEPKRGFVVFLVGLAWCGLLNCFSVTLLSLLACVIPGQLLSIFQSWLNAAHGWMGPSLAISLASAAALLIFTPSPHSSFPRCPFLLKSNHTIFTAFGD